MLMTFLGVKNKIKILLENNLKNKNILIKFIKVKHKMKINTKKNMRNKKFFMF